MQPAASIRTASDKNAISGSAPAQPAHRVTQRRPAYIAQAVSYVIDGAILFAYAGIGVTTVTTGLVYLTLRLAVVGVAFFLSEARVTDRFRDHYLFVPLSLVSITIQIGAIYLVPQIGFYFIAIIFVVLGFGALRMSARQTGIVWAYATLGLAVLFLMTDRPIGIPMADATERALALACFVSALARCAGAGLYGSSMRELLYRRSNDLAAANARIEELAQLDELTGAYNRRYIMKCLGDEIARVQRGASCCVALIDLDHFKRINDRFGHPIGDEVLRTFAITIFSNIRMVDKLGRYGGEEFLLVLPETHADQALQIIERLRTAIEGLGWPAISPDLTLTISAGLSEIVSNDTPEDLLARADRALYRAKDAGRNRVLAATQRRRFG
ncbi:MAG: GGDEF domain-containing protein [Bradyrhizobiaceae bacterium PARB1]|jgi:diguanylate cyclase|nr:MAG: GGDEF domain-containing protein [Bradyrhizobiaceae bacterium PARB1]